MSCIEVIDVSSSNLKGLVQLYPSLTAVIKCTGVEMFILKAAR